MAEKEYIERETAIKAAVSGLHGVTSITALEMVEELEGVPAADVVEVVRCKACENFEPHGNGKAGKCKDNRCRGIRYADDFCSYGERKEQE